MTSTVLTQFMAELLSGKIKIVETASANVFNTIPKRNPRRRRHRAAHPVADKPIHVGRHGVALAFDVVDDAA